MRKKLDTRFPAARIKKIMQSDEDVGKIAMAVPLLVSKALELCLQDLCNWTYKITLARGAKTMNSSHLKQCVQNLNVFDFLRDIVSKVPDLGGSQAASEDLTVTKRRKVVNNEPHLSDDELKRKMHEAAQNGCGGRGRGRGRGRGCGQGSRMLVRHLASRDDNCEDGFDNMHQNGYRSIKSLHNGKTNGADKENLRARSTGVVRDFDLNLDLDEDGNSPRQSAEVKNEKHTANSPSHMATDMKHEELPGWSLSDMEKMDIDPIQLANINVGIHDDEEDYDAEA